MESQDMFKTLDQSNSDEARSTFIAYLKAASQALGQGSHPAHEIAYEIAGMFASRFARDLRDDDPLIEIMTIAGELETNPANANVLVAELTAKINALK